MSCAEGVDAIQRLEPSVQNYAWGVMGSDASLVARMAGGTPDPSKPYAELWMGSHPSAPSKVGGEGMSDFMKRNKEFAGSVANEEWGWQVHCSHGCPSTLAPWFRGIFSVEAEEDPLCGSSPAPLVLLEPLALAPAHRPACQIHLGRAPRHQIAPSPCYRCPHVRYAANASSSPRILRHDTRPAALPLQVPLGSVPPQHTGTPE